MLGVRERIDGDAVGKLAERSWTQPRKNSLLLALVLLTGVFTVHAPRAAAQTPALRPGESFVMEFPELRPDRRGDVAKMRVRIPETYSPHKLYPLFVWLGGGAGSSNYGPGYRIADPKQFVLVGLPYPKGANDKRQKTMVGDFRRIWSYHTAMLNALKQRVPNISPRHVSVGGFSNGAHCIDGYLKMREPAQFFNAFILVEGGGYRSGRYESSIRGKPALVLWGEHSRHRSVGIGLARRLRSAGMVVKSAEMRDTKHRFPIVYQEFAHQWLTP